MEVKPDPLADELLEPWRAALGGDFEGYRNHVQRVLAYCGMLARHDAETREKLAVAGAFHDLGIWTAGTLDYLGPSRALAAAWLEANGKSGWLPEIEAVIELHHKLSSASDDSPLAEIFRKADAVDMSLGMRRHGLDRAAVRAVMQAFPDHGFHMRLAVLALKRLLTHPLDPLPMLRR